MEPTSPSVLSERCSPCPHPQTENHSFLEWSKPLSLICHGVTESFRLQKTSRIIESNLWLSPPCQPDQGTECHSQSFFEHLEGSTSSPPWASVKPFQCLTTFPWRNSFWCPEFLLIPPSDPFLPFPFAPHAQSQSLVAPSVVLQSSQPLNELCDICCLADSHGSNRQMII